MNGEKPATDRSVTCHNIPHPTLNLDGATPVLDAGEGPDLARCVHGWPYGGEACADPSRCMFSLPCWGGSLEGTAVARTRVVAVRVEGRTYVRQVVEGISTRVEVLRAPRGLAAVVRLALECAGLPCDA